MVLENLVNCKLCEKEIKQSQNRKRTRCGSCNTKIRRFRAKAAAIAFLGGKCLRCNYSGPQAAMEFHHLFDKEFSIGHVSNRAWEVIKRELEKCELLCSNCHRIEHSDREDPRLISEALNYDGRLFL